jgi:hypothetical protein
MSCVPVGLSEMNEMTVVVSVAAFGAAFVVIPVATG